MNKDETCWGKGIKRLTVDKESPQRFLEKLTWKAIKQITKNRDRKTNECGTCRYKGVKGLIADEELHPEILEKLSAQDIADVTKYYGYNFPDYQSAILYGGPGELLHYSKIIDLSNRYKDYSPFETAEGRILNDFGFCFGRLNGYLENISDSEMQTMVAMGRLIDISREINDGNGKIAMLTYKKYKGCCPFHEGVSKFDLSATMEYLKETGKGYQEKYE